MQVIQSQRLKEGQTRPDQTKGKGARDLVLILEEVMDLPCS